MKYVSLPNDEQHRLCFYLAMEEYAAQTLVDDDDCFFMWQVEPTVIFGRHQAIENEVNIDYCKENGIQFYRRKSGGGCVYADRNNVMLSYITNDENVDNTFARYMSMFAEALCKLGFDAWKNDHNDIMIGNKKVSGNAIYRLPGSIITHGTLLYDTDMEHMMHAITPSRQKLDRHGVESVRQRICLLKDYTPLPFADIRAKIRQHLCQTTYTLTEHDREKVREIELEYLDPQFIGIAD